MGAFTKIFQRLRLTSDSNVATQTTAVIQADTTNSSIAIVPNGTGAIIAAIPDGTVTGGNARGSYAVDLQSTRSGNTRVASGNYSFVAGNNNIATGQNSVALGYQCESYGNGSIAIGFQTIASNTAAVSFGYQNNVSALGANANGWMNTVSSQYSTISGGQSNTASTNTHATVVGGQSNTSSGQHSISGGSNNLASGIRSVSFGFFSSSSGQISTTFGRATIASGDYSMAIGNESNSFYLNSFSTSGGQFAVAGDSQQTLLTFRRSAVLTTSGTTLLSLDGTIGAAGIIPNGNNRAWNVQIDTIAVVTAITGTATGVSVGDTYQEKTTLSFKRVGGTSSLVALGSRQQVYDTSMSTAIMNFSAGASQQLQLQFQSPTFAGGGSITCRVVSKVSLVEVAY